MARRRVLELLPHNAEVFNNTSRTLESIGVAEDVERSGLYRPVRLELYQMDREMQAREMRKLAAAPDFVVGSAHALTEQGSLLVASTVDKAVSALGGGARAVAGGTDLVVGARQGKAPLPEGLVAIRRYGSASRVTVARSAPVGDGARRHGIP